MRTVKTILIIMLSFTLLVLCSCTKGDKDIIGTWELEKDCFHHSEDVYTYAKFTFNPDKKMNWEYRQGNQSDYLHDIRGTFSPTTQTEGTITTSALMGMNVKVYYKISGNKMTIYVNGGDLLVLKKK